MRSHYMNIFRTCRFGKPRAMRDTGRVIKSDGRCIFCSSAGETLLNVVQPEQDRYSTLKV